jgi:crotonobetainyl-CoA:carnitine CoA-transferase CaiB-like acyl-CoA transferase
MGITGEEGGGPLRGGGALADFVGGLYLAIGLLAGLRDVDRTGRAQVLDLSNQDAIFAITDSAASIFAGIGEEMEPVGNQHPFTAPYDAFPATDGHVAIGSASNKLFRQLMTAMGRAELGTDERFRSHRGRAAGRHEVNAVVGEWVATRSCQEVLTALGPEGADVPCARVARPAELLDDEQLEARGMIERHSHPTLGEVVFHGNPLQFSHAAPRERALAPVLGQDNAEVFGELGLGAEEMAALAEKGVI